MTQRSGARDHASSGGSLSQHRRLELEVENGYSACGAICARACCRGTCASGVRHAVAEEAAETRPAYLLSRSSSSPRTRQVVEVGHPVPGRYATKKSTGRAPGGSGGPGASSASGSRTKARCASRDGAPGAPARRDGLCHTGAGRGRGFWAPAPKTAWRHRPRNVLDLEQQRKGSRARASLSRAANRRARSGAGSGNRQDRSRPGRDRRLDAVSSRSACYGRAASAPVAVRAAGATTAGNRSRVIATIRCSCGAAVCSSHSPRGELCVRPRLRASGKDQQREPYQDQEWWLRKRRRTRGLRRRQGRARSR